MDNRLTAASGEAYAYTPVNQRVWLRKSGGTERFAFYDLNGQRLAAYTPWVNGGTLYFVQVKAELYFGGKRIRSGGFAVAEDRLGSTRREATTASRFFPWGEENGSTANDRQKFGTYYRDAGTGLDYANQRYYSATVGRFLTPDPYMASGGAADPGSWNRYAYTRGDPVGRADPEGLEDVAVDIGWIIRVQVDRRLTARPSAGGVGRGGGWGAEHAQLEAMTPGDLMLVAELTSVDRARSYLERAKDAIRSAVENNEECAGFHRRRRDSAEDPRRAYRWCAGW